MIINTQSTVRVGFAEYIRQTDSGHGEAASGILIVGILVHKSIGELEGAFENHGSFLRLAEADRVFLSENSAFMNEREDVIHRAALFCAVGGRVQDPNRFPCLLQRLIKIALFAKDLAGN